MQNKWKTLLESTLESLIFESTATPGTSTPGTSTPGTSVPSTNVSSSTNKLENTSNSNSNSDTKKRVGKNPMETALFKILDEEYPDPAAEGSKFLKDGQAFYITGKKNAATQASNTLKNVNLRDMTPDAFMSFIKTVSDPFSYSWEFFVNSALYKFLTTKSIKKQFYTNFINAVNPITMIPWQSANKEVAESFADYQGNITWEDDNGIQLMQEYWKGVNDALSSASPPAKSLKNGLGWGEFCDEKELIRSEEAPYFGCPGLFESPQWGPRYSRENNPDWWLQPDPNWNSVSTEEEIKQLQAASSKKQEADAEWNEKYGRNTKILNIF